MGEKENMLRNGSEINSLPVPFCTPPPARWNMQGSHKTRVVMGGNDTPNSGGNFSVGFSNYESLRAIAQCHQTCYFVAFVEWTRY